MIGFLRGIVYYVGIDYVLLDVHDVGYRINFSRPEKLKVGEEITIFTYQRVAEDDISLFGFLSLAEYDLFIKLISVKGLGPKTASAILSAASVDNIVSAIESGDLAFMKRMPGVGAKTASQIILDLKGKLVQNEEPDYRDDLQDVVDALKSLGYKPAEIKPVIKQLQKEKLSSDEYIRKALNLLRK